jgi:hypothetical protein
MKPIPYNNSRRSSSSRSGLRAAVLATFCQGAGEVAKSLYRLDERAWLAELEWLDVSGLALYLLDRLCALGQEEVLPEKILARLRQNLADNRRRTAVLLAEADEINRGFEREAVLFANLKGITLSPESVHDPALRCQLDLDFMIFAEHAERARNVLEGFGYALDCKSGSTWEFKAGSAYLPSLQDLYKPKLQRSAELHLAAAEGLLKRTELRAFYGVELRALSFVDLYLAQAQHLFKHLCSSHTRASWVLEARQHMLARYGDDAFWRKIDEHVAVEPHTAVALSVVTLLIVEVFGDVPPEYLTRLAASGVPPSVKLWIAEYGRRVLLVDRQGSKHYLLLLAALPGLASKPSRKHLVPLRLPPMITHPSVDETLFARMRRYQIQLAFILYRLRFHCVEGARYLVESFRFRRLLMGVEQ